MEDSGKMALLPHWLSEQVLDHSTTPKLDVPPPGAFSSPTQEGLARIKGRNRGNQLSTNSQGLTIVHVGVELSPPPISFEHLPQSTEHIQRSKHFSWSTRALQGPVGCYIGIHDWRNRSRYQWSSPDSTAWGLIDAFGAAL